MIKLGVKVDTEENKKFHFRLTPFFSLLQRHPHPLADDVTRHLRNEHTHTLVPQCKYASTWNCNTAFSRFKREKTFWSLFFRCSTCLDAIGNQRYTTKREKEKREAGLGFLSFSFGWLMPNLVLPFYQSTWALDSGSCWHGAQRKGVCVGNIYPYTNI